MSGRQTLAEAIEYWCDIEVLHPGDLLSSIDNDNGTHRVIVTPALEALASIEPIISDRTDQGGVKSVQCPNGKCNHSVRGNYHIDESYLTHVDDCAWARARQLCGET